MKDNEASQMYGDALGTQTWLADLRPANSGPSLSADDGLSTGIKTVQTLSLDIVNGVGWAI